MDEQLRPTSHTEAVIDRLLRAVNDHDVGALVACFHEDYVNETPAHPKRGFRGSEQVRHNWSRIFAAMPDIAASIPRRTVDGDTVWTEWEMSGTRRDGQEFVMRGVVIFMVVEATIASARFYLEPVEETSGDVDAAIDRSLGTVTRALDSADGDGPRRTK